MDYTIRTTKNLYTIHHILPSSVINYYSPTTRPSLRGGSILPCSSREPLSRTILGGKLRKLLPNY